MSQIVKGLYLVAPQTLHVSASEGFFSPQVPHNQVPASTGLGAHPAAAQLFTRGFGGDGCETAPGLSVAHTSHFRVAVDGFLHEHRVQVHVPAASTLGAKPEAAQLLGIDAGAGAGLGVAIELGASAPQTPHFAVAVAGLSSMQTPHFHCPDAAGLGLNPAADQSKEELVEGASGVLEEAKLEEKSNFGSASTGRLSAAAAAGLVFGSTDATPVTVTLNV